MQRRTFLKSSTTLISMLPLIDISQFNIFNSTFLTDDEVVKIKIGKCDCTIFRDQMFKYLAKDFFINASEAELNQSLNKYRVTADNIPSPFIAVLFQYDDKKILIDTGIGFSEKPVIFRGNTYVFKGGLHQLLQKENIKKEDITDVIITHFHPDHIGGIFTENRELNFPNARFHMHEDEWDAFLHPLHIERLEWQTNYDFDHQKAKQSRVKLLELAYKENMLVNAFHFDFPGLGRIDKFKNNWIWNYSEN